MLRVYNLIPNSCLMAKPMSDRIKPPAVLAIATAIYILLFGAIGVWRYGNFSYNAMDLAILNQVFYNSAHGDLFASSIHPPTYLADHLELVGLILLPVYAIFQHPITLLLLQTLVLGLSAWPVYRLGRSVLDQRWGLLLGIAWLLNPFVQNINLFEFHLLPFAIFPLLWACVAYQQKRFWPFIAWSILALLVREDVALVVMMFGLLALVEHRPRRWRLAPFLLGAGYFLVALQIINRVADFGRYKFFIYYSWLGDSWLEIARTTLLRPWPVLKHLITVGNFEFALGLLLPFVFLPLLASRYLLLGLLIFLQFAMGSFGGSGGLLQLHYPALLLPALVMATVAALKIITTAPAKINRAIELIRRDPRLSLLIFSAGVLYTSLTMGPLPGVVMKFLRDGIRWPAAAAQAGLIKKIPPDASVAASYAGLTALSSRQHLASLNYLFLGKQQFLSRDYRLPADTEYLLIDYQDFITYQLQYGPSSFYQDSYHQALTHWPALLDGFGLVELRDTLALYQKNQPDRYRLVTVWDRQPPIVHSDSIPITEAVTFIGADRIEPNGYQLFWQVHKPPAGHYQLLLVATQNGAEAYQKIYPLAYDIVPSTLWQAGTVVQTNYWFDLESYLEPGTYELSVQAVEIKKGGLEVDAIRSTHNVVDRLDRIGPVITIDN